MTEQPKDKWLVCKYLVMAKCSRPGTCAMQEKCSEYADFCESIMDELTENEDEDPPCPIKCDKRADPNQASLDAIRAEAARKARDEALALLEGWDYLNNRNFGTPRPVFADMIRLVREKPEEVKEHIQSLRHPGREKGGSGSTTTDNSGTGATARRRKTPNPGSDAAIKEGCTCPILDNCHGMGGEPFGGFWINSNCPLHGTAAGRTRRNEQR